MSSSQDFLKKMMEVGEANSASQDFITVARMIIKPGYSGFLADHRPIEFFRAYDKPDQNTVDACIASVAELLQLAGSKRDPVFAFLFNMPVDTNTAEKVTWEIEQVTLLDTRKDTDDHVNEYKIFTNAMFAGDFPLNEWFWGSYKNVETGEYVNGAGEDKKRFVAFPVEVFANEAEARASAPESNAAKSDSQWSDTVKANYPDIAIFKENYEQILGAYDKIKKGELPYTGASPLPAPSTPPKQKQYLADMFDCATSDIDIILAMPPF